VKAPGVIEVSEFLRVLGIPVLSVEGDEHWIDCPYCREPTCHIAPAKTTRWLMFFCETCGAGKGANGVSLWMHVRDVIDAKALQEIKLRLLGRVPKKSPEQKRAAKDARVIELRREHADKSASEFVREVLRVEFECSESTAWRLWRRPAVVEGVTDPGVTDPGMSDPLPSLAAPEGVTVTVKKRGSTNAVQVARGDSGSNVDKPAISLFDSRGLTA
jgi:hypothetical protein